MYENYYLQALTFINDNVSDQGIIPIASVHLGLSESLTTSILDELSDGGYTKQSINSLWLTNKGGAYLEANNPKMRPLRIQILEYLKEKDAVDTKIDVALPFLDADDSTDARSKLGNALDYLAREKFIILSGDPIMMLAKQAGQHPSKYHTGLLASITPLGCRQIEPSKDTSIHFPPIYMENVHMHENYNIKNSQVGAIGHHAKSDTNTFQQTQYNIPINLDFEELQKEIYNLKKAMKADAETSEQFAAVQNVASAQEAAEKKDGNAVVKFLKAGGKWVFDTAKEIGISLVTELIKDNI
jgi:hypothetical protein